MGIAFSSCEELYRRITPALRTKVREFQSKRIFTISEEDIWCYLKDEKWNMQNGLTLASMVNDILTVECEEILIYINNV